MTNDKTKAGASAPAASSSPDLVEVRLLGKLAYKHETPAGIVDRKPGETFMLERAIYDRSIEPDRGMGRPARSRNFALVAEESAQAQAQAQSRAAVQSRIDQMRASVQEQESAREAGRAIAVHQRAEEAKARAEALTKPLERVGAQRTV